MMGPVQMMTAQPYLCLRRAAVPVLAMSPFRCAAVLCSASKFSELFLYILYRFPRENPVFGQDARLCFEFGTKRQRKLRRREHYNKVAIFSCGCNFVSVSFHPIRMLCF